MVHTVIGLGVLTRTWTVTVNCSVYCRSNDDRTRSLQILAKYQ